MKAVFLDRDGVINVPCSRKHDYIKSVSEFQFLPGVTKAIRQLNDKGYLVLVVTNQRGVARGMMTMEQVNIIHEYMQMRLAESGAHLDGIYVCPHDYGQCHCRKPDIGLFLQAEKEFAIDKEKSWMVGDSDTDIQAGQNYGVKTIKTTNLSETVKIILGGRR